MVLLAPAFLLALSWLLFQFWLYGGWQRLKKRHFPFANGALLKEGLSVIIPFRNEEAHLPSLLSSLKNLSPPDRMPVEWIFVDDHSADGSVAIIQSFLEKNPLPGEVVVMASAGEGKKAAQAAGVMQARYPWLLFSDADCEWPAERLQALEALPARDSWQLLSCPVVYDEQTPRLMAMEFESLVYAGAALIGRGFPVLGNGASMLCKKAAWMACSVKLLAIPSASGDDVFLMQCVALHYGPDSVGFLDAPSFTVKTRGPRTWPEFFEQRRRWAGKTLLFPSPAGRLTAVYVWLIHAGLLTFFILALLMGEIVYVPLGVATTSKIVGDMPFYFLVSHTSGRNLLEKFLWFMPAQVFTTLHFTLTPLASIALGYTWKGRRHRT